MQLKYGTYSFPINGCRVTSDAETRFSEGDTPLAIVVRMSVSGWLEADGQSALTSAQQSLESALQTPYLDLILLRDDGSESATILKNRNSISGVTIRHLRFPGNVGAEYATLREFSFEAMAEYPASGSVNFLVSWEEDMSFSGGGAMYVHRPSLTGDSQKQLVYPRTHYTVVQRGQAVGYRDWPIPPGPRWANDLKQAPEIRRFGPQRKGFGFINYGVAWSYTYESIREMIGVPNAWPTNLF